MSKEFTKNEKILKIRKKANRAISCQPRQACKTGHAHKAFLKL